MLGTTGNGGSRHGDMIPRVPHDEPRPNSVPVPVSHISGRASPRQHENDPRNSIFRASSQPPVPVQPEAARYFPPQQQDVAYSLAQHHYQQHNRLSTNNGSASHSLPIQFHLHNQPVLNPNTFSNASPLDRDREREREKEEERRQRDLVRERERFEGAKTPSGRYESRIESSSRRGSSHSHVHATTHHHHHLHHAHPTFKQPKLTIDSEKVFDEARQYPEINLGRWTYNPTQRLPDRLVINGVMTVHIPRRFLVAENNSALRRRRLWGTEIYTDDSDLAALLIHSTSKLPPTGDLEIIIRVMPRLWKYKSSMRNDLRSRGWLTKHDGLSLYIEKCSPVSWTRETAGKGFAKRSISEMLYLARESILVPVSCSDWRPQKYSKLDNFESLPPIAQIDCVTRFDEAPNLETTTAQEAVDTEEPEGDDTIELITTDQEIVAETSFVQPQGPLISHMPETLPTDLANFSSETGPARGHQVDSMSHEDEKPILDTATSETALVLAPLDIEASVSASLSSSIPLVPDVLEERGSHELEPVVRMIQAHAEAEASVDQVKVED